MSGEFKLGLVLGSYVTGLITTTVTFHLLGEMGEKVPFWVLLFIVILWPIFLIMIVATYISDFVEFTVWPFLKYLRNYKKSQSL